MNLSGTSKLSRWWLNRSVRAKGLLVLAVPMIAFITVTVAALSLQIQERSERALSIRANAIVRTAQALLANAMNGEVGTRGYAVTANPDFLGPYNDAAAARDALTAAVLAAAVTDEEKAQAATVAATAAEQFSKLDELQAAVAAGRSGAGLAPELVAGKAVMDRLRVEVQTMIDGPATLVDQKRTAINQLESRIEVVQIAGLVAGLLAGLGGVALFTSGISRRVKSAADNAQRLGDGEPLLPTVPSTDEIGRLGDSLRTTEELLATRLDELAATRDVAVRATETKNTFLSRTSHELRTPLNAILGFAQLLEMSELSADDRESTRHILGAGRHLLALINELIDTAQIESGDIRLSVEPVRLGMVVAEVAGLIAPLAAARQITVTVDDTESGIAALADHQRLRQVLVNLASNAVKYNRVGGTITLGCRSTSSELIEVWVRDTGPGLTAEEVERVFVPFERLEAEQHGIEGTGIGLPLSLALARAMDGTLVVDSVPGWGSTFTVRLPRAPDFPPDDEPVGPLRDDETADGAEAESGADAPLLVLSIEDNEANTALLARFFKGLPGTRFRSAGSACEGTELARTLVPDLVLLDLHLPEISGEEVFAQLRAEPATAQVPIVVLSADATIGTRRRLLARGALAYLTKPLDLQSLQDVLDPVLAARRSRDTAGSTHSS